MANTYSQIYIQVIFAVKFRESKISDEMKNEVEKYICGIFNNKKQKVLAIYANADHIHIFFCYRNISISIPDLMKVVKVESTNFINEKKFAIEAIALITNTIPGMVIGIAYMMFFSGTTLQNTFALIK